MVTEELDGLGADLGVGISREGRERGEGGRMLRGELAEAPDGVEACVGRGVGLGGRSGEGGEAFGLAGGEFELGGAADAGVGVAEEGAEFGDGFLGVVGGDEGLGFRDNGVVGVGGVGDGVDAAAFGLGPAVGPVGPVEAAVGAEFHVGGEGAAEETLGFVHGVGGAVGFELVGEDSGAGRVADEGGDEEGAAEGVVEAGAGVVGDAGGAVLEVGEGARWLAGWPGKRGARDGRGSMGRRW